MKKNKKIIMRIINIVIFILVAFLTFYIIFKKNNIFLIIKNLKRVNILYILLACFFMLIYIACEGINIRRILKTLNDKISFKDSFKYASVGFFFSAITPSASGGDPAQLYFMKKDKLSISHSALALLVELTSFELICCLLSITGYIYNYDLISNGVGKLKYLVIIGITLNILYITFLLIMIFSKKIALKLSNLIIKILTAIHYRKVDSLKEKLQSQIEEYHNCSIYIKNNKKLLIKVILTTLIELILYHSVPYCIYLSFGLSDINIITFITMSALLYTSVAFLPLPGSMGVSEGSFIVLYRVLFPPILLSSSMLLSRAVNYYIFVIFTGILILVNITLEKINKNKKTKCKAN